MYNSDDGFEKQMRYRTFSDLLKEQNDLIREHNELQMQILQELKMSNALKQKEYDQENDYTM